MLTREEILALPAGRELDAIIAEQVFGWWQEHGTGRDNGFQIYSPSDSPDFPKCYGWARNDQPRLGDRQPEYSTTISAAWLVVEAVQQRGGFFKLENGAGGDTKGWRAELVYRGSFYDPHLCPTAPLAICRAALLAAPSPSPLPPTEKEPA